MKLEIDFENKTVKVLTDATIGEIVEKLKELNLKWEEFTIVQEPIVINIPAVNPSYPVFPVIPYYPVDPMYGKYKITC